MLRAALVGLPGSGKTTLFHLMTNARDHAVAASRGKTDAQIGISRVPDARLDRLTAMFNPRKRVPATVELADTAGPATDTRDLTDVSAFRNADALLHVVRAFRDPAVPHTLGALDPARDAQRIEDEVILTDLGIAERRLERVAKDLKKARTGELEREHEVLLRCRASLEQGAPLRSLTLDADEHKRLRGFQFLSAKPLLLVVNIDETDLTEGGGTALAEAPVRAGLEGFLSRAATRAVGVCAKIELEIAQLDEASAVAFLADLDLIESGVDRIIRASYDLLGYISFFTVGEDECRAWSIVRGTIAQGAAGEIHSDISRGFIRAEVVPYDALVARGSLAACRERGDLRLEGKEYVVRDGDVINFRFAT